MYEYSIRLLMSLVSALRILSLACIVILLSGTLSIGGLGHFQKAFAQPSITYGATSNPLHGMVFYVTEGQELMVPFISTGTLRQSGVPPGANVATSSIVLGSNTVNTATLSWTPGQLVGQMLPEDIGPDNPPSAVYAAKFTSTESGATATARISIVVRSAVYDQPDPVIRLDKPSYALAETVRATIEDPNALCNYVIKDISRDFVTLAALKGKPSPGPPELTFEPEEIQRAEDGSGDIIAEIALNNADIPGIEAAIESRGVQGNLDIRMTYNRLACPGSTAVVGSDSEIIQIRSADISFERSQYSIGESPVVILSGAPTVAPRASALNASGHEIISSLPVNSVSADRYVINLAGVSEADLLRADRIKAVYSYSMTEPSGTSFPFETSAEAKLLERGLKIDQSAHLNSNDGVVLMLKDPSLNTDPNSPQLLDLAYVTSISGTTIANGAIPQFLRETGPDTAVFSNEVYLYFIREGDPEPPGRFIPVDGTQNTTLTLSVGANSFSTVVEPFEVRGSPEGTGSTDESPPAAPQYHASAGGTVLLTCSLHGWDSDNDGICNNWESPATGGPLIIPYNGGSFEIEDSCLAPAAAGCPDSQHKDIYLEADYTGGSEGYSTSSLTTALESVRTLFNTAPIPNSVGGNGIKFHYYVSENIGTTTSKEEVDVWTNIPGGSTSNDYNKHKDDYFGTPAERNSGSTPTDATKARFQVFHYALFAWEQNQDPGSSGNGEPIGNDIIVTLRPFDPLPGQINILDQIRGTLLHELGHNLGLYHGGPSTITGYNVNCKPNYLSVMTYIRQMTTAYGTQRYSDSLNYPPSLDTSNGLFDSSSGSVLRLGSDSSAGSPKVVWSIDNGANKPIATITTSAGTINWKNSGAEPDNPDPETLHILDVGITGCTHATNAHGDILYGADDWVGIELNLNFREINPTLASSGFSNGYLPDDELDSATLTEIQVMGVESSYYLIESIPYLDYRKPYNNPTDEALIEAELKCRLIDETNNGTGTCTDNYVPNTVSTESVVDLIRADDIATAVKKLEEIRLVMDEEGGGHPFKDLYSSTSTYTPIDPPAEPIILPMLDNNIASLKLSKLNIPFEFAENSPGKDQSFEIVTFDGNCEDHLGGNSTAGSTDCTVTGTGQTITNATATFAFNRHDLFVDIIGEGFVSFKIPENIARSANDVVSEDSGQSIPFTESFDKSTGILTVNATFDWYPRLVNIQHDKPAVNASVSTDYCGGKYQVLFPYANRNSTFFVTVDNNNPTNASTTILLRISNATHTSLFEGEAALDLDGKESDCVPIHWLTPNPSLAEGIYNVLVQVIESDFGVYPTESKLRIYADP